MICLSGFLKDHLTSIDLWAISFGISQPGTVMSLSEIKANFVLLVRIP